MTIDSASIADERYEARLARDMIDVHGADAAKVARENARFAALVGQRSQVRRWLRVVGIIQRPAGPTRL